MGGQLTFLTIPAGDWLQAGANIAGVAATILGTLWLERRLNGRRDRRRIREILNRLIALRGEFENHVPATMMTAVTVSLSLMAQMMLLNTIDQYRFVRNRANIADADQWLSLERVESAIAAHEAGLRSEYQRLLEAGQNPAVYATNYDFVLGAIAEIGVEAEDARRLLR